MTADWLGKILFRKTNIELNNHDMNALGSLSFSRNNKKLLNTRFPEFMKEATKEQLEKHQLRLGEEIILEGNLDGYSAIAGDLKLFANCNMTVRELIKYRSAVAVFPLSSNSPVIRHLWIFEDPDNRIETDHLSLLQNRGALAEIYPKLKVFIVPDTEFVGNSWELAFHLAKIALCKKSLREKLAREWIVSGAVDMNRQVRKVTIGNKFLIETDRNWLLPWANYGDWPSNWHPNGHVFVAGSVDEATNRIVGRNVQKGVPIPWPDNIKHIYSLSSRAETTVVVAAILSRLTEITVFCSSNQEISIAPALHIKSFLEKHTDIQVSIAEDIIPSDDVYEIEQYMEKKMRLNKSTANTELVLLHVTTGTKLMLLAASNIARNYPNVWLVYRDISLNDKSSTDFISINYNSLQPTTHILECNNIRMPVSHHITTKHLLRLLNSRTIEEYKHSI